MRRVVCTILFFCCSWWASRSLQAQSYAAYIPDRGQLFVFPNDTVSIFSPMINHGSLGTQSGAVVNFAGTAWINSPQASLPDESIDGHSGQGGLFRFLPPLSGGQQTIEGGFSLATDQGPAFPNLSIANQQGVSLGDLGDLHVRHELRFERGRLYLNGWNLLVGDGDAGNITGYDNQRYVVTDTSVFGGMLYRDRIQPSDSAVAFPIGTDAYSYSPGAVMLTRGSGRMGMRVFNHVYTHAIRGSVNDLDYVRKTWYIQASNADMQYHVLLQHQQSDEGPRFAAYRDSSYVSLYNPTKGLWDVDSISLGRVFGGQIAYGNIRLSDSYMNLRQQLHAPNLNNSTASGQYLSVSTLIYSGDVCPSVHYNDLLAVRTSPDYVELFWHSVGERNMAYYVVQRQIQGEANFQDIDTIKSQAAGGFSSSMLYYHLNDYNPTDQWSYYRLKMVGLSGCIRYTSIMKVPWAIQILITPNPNNGQFAVHLRNVKHPIRMLLINVPGEVLKQWTITRDQDIQVQQLSDATYFIEFYDARDNSYIGQQKIVVIH
ncbi:MAG: T9SS type A sorting domain-containing protein [Thermoflavifilum sp.]|nr:T9SS type A sorting domain-containing protein [Thermoflavifilum sp.]